MPSFSLITAGMTVWLFEVTLEMMDFLPMAVRYLTFLPTSRAKHLGPFTRLVFHERNPAGRGSGRVSVPRTRSGMGQGSLERESGAELPRFNGCHRIAGDSVSWRWRPGPPAA